MPYDRGKNCWVCQLGTVSGRVIGVDMTDAMLAKAKENIAAAGFTNVEVRKALIEDLPVANSSVDWVISNCVINLSPEKTRVFHEIARVLRPGGRISISDMIVEGLPAELRSLAALYSACVGGAIGETEYLQGLRDAGLDEVKVEERLVYSGAQVAALVESELPTQAQGGGCCSLGGLVQSIARQFEGKVWSARISARKPESPRG